jgi:RNA polymerase sigma-B factor
VVSASVTTQRTMENAGGKPNRGDNATATADLLHAYLQRGDITARDRLIELYLPLVESFAHRYERSDDYDDLFQAGCIGLINAIDRFDLKRGGELAAFAVPNIVGEIKRHLRDRTTSVRTPRPIQELRARAMRCETELSAKLQRRPTAAEVAGELGVDKEAVARALSIGRPGGEQEDASPREATLDALDVSEDRLALASAFEALDERERQIVYLRFVRDRSRSQVAKELGISERHLSRQTHAALAKLRDQLERAAKETVTPPERSRRATATVRSASRPPSRRETPRPSPKVSGGRFTRSDGVTDGGHSGEAPKHRDLPYHISVVRDHGNAEGHEWTARAEELPGCEAHGDSIEEAIHGIEAAIEEWIEDARAKGREVPDPRKEASYSGRLMLRMPRSLHAELSAAAERQEVSLNQFIANSLERALAPHAAATGESVKTPAADRRPVPALLRLAIIVNLIVVLVAAVVAVVILVVASQQGW